MRSGPDLRPGAFDGNERNAGWRGETGEHRRIVAAQVGNSWRRQDTAASLGISRKVRWETMRKFRIADNETGPA